MYICVNSHCICEAIAKQILKLYASSTTLFNLWTVLSHLYQKIYLHGGKNCYTFVFGLNQTFCEIKLNLLSCFFVASRHITYMRWIVIAVINMKLHILNICCSFIMKMTSIAYAVCFEF